MGGSMLRRMRRVPRLQRAHWTAAWVGVAFSWSGIASWIVMVVALGVWARTAAVTALGAGLLVFLVGYRNYVVSAATARATEEAEAVREKAKRTFETALMMQRIEGRDLSDIDVSTEATDAIRKGVHPQELQEIANRVRDAGKDES